MAEHTIRLGFVREKLKVVSSQEVYRCNVSSCNRTFTERKLLLFHLGCFHKQQGDNGFTTDNPDTLAAATTDIVPLPETLKEIEHLANQNKKKKLSPSKLIGSKANGNKLAATQGNKIKESGATNGWISTPVAKKQPTSNPLKKLCSPLKPVLNGHRLSSRSPEVPHSSSKESRLVNRLNDRVQNGIKPHEISLPNLKANHVKSFTEKSIPKKNKLTDESSPIPAKKARIEEQQTCEYCPMSFTDLDSYTQHLKVKHRIKNTQGKFPCSFCPVQCINEEGWHSHFEKHLSKFKNQYPCSKCPKYFETEAERKQHKTSTGHPDCGAMRCPLCPRKFSNLKERYIHVFKDHFKNHISETRMFLDITACSLCFLAFPTVKEADLHAQTEHFGGEASKLSCTYCSVKCANSFLLNSHISKSHATKPSSSILCSLCKRTFPSQSAWEAHFPSHLELKTGPFQCEICEKEFRTVEQLSNHNVALRHWPDQLPPTCFLCLEESSSRWHWARHLLSHLSGHWLQLKEYLESLVCTECKKVVDSPRHKLTHLRKGNLNLSSTQEDSAVLINGHPDKSSEKVVAGAWKNMGKTAKVYYHCQICPVPNLKRLVGLKHHLKSKLHQKNYSKTAAASFQKSCLQCKAVFTDILSYVLHRVDTILTPDPSHRGNQTTCEFCRSTPTQPSFHILSHINITASEDPLEDSEIKNGIPDLNASTSQIDQSPSTSGLQEVMPDSSLEEEVPPDVFKAGNDARKLSRDFSHLLYMAVDNAALLTFYNFGTDSVEVVLRNMLQGLGQEPEDGFEANIRKFLRTFIDDQLMENLEKDYFSTSEIVTILINYFKEMLANSLTEPQ